MKAVGYYEPGAIERDDALLDLDVPRPTPRPRDLLVRIEAVSVNPVDVKMRMRDRPRQGQPRILGWDAAGVVEAVGAEVTLFRPGDEVFYAGARERQGTNAEYHVVDERVVGPKPKSLDFVGAAALPLTSLTAWELLFERLRVPLGVKRAGGTLLVVNGAGGVGSILIQLARRLTGLRVVATASRNETIGWARAMGAHDVIDHRGPLHEGLRAIGLHHVEYVASLTASDRHHAALIEAIAPQGKIALIDDPKGGFDVAPFKAKSVTVVWESMFTRSSFETADMAEQHRILTEVSALADAGVLRTTLAERAGAIDAANLRKAHRKSESGTAIGKMVLAGF